MKNTSAPKSKPAKKPRKDKDSKFAKQQSSLQKRIQLEEKLSSDEDYILSPKHRNSLKKLLLEKPDGVTDSMIMRCLKISSPELKERLAKILAMLRNKVIGEDHA